MRNILSLTLGFLAVAALGAAGDDGEGKKAAKPANGSAGGLHLNFKALDTNGDGMLSKEEWMAVFNKLNANGDAALSEAEFSAGSPAYPCPAQSAPANPKKKGEGK